MRALAVVAVALAVVIALETRVLAVQAMERCQGHDAGMLGALSAVSGTLAVIAGPAIVIAARRTALRQERDADEDD
jgi:hypothetical protein